MGPYSGTFSLVQNFAEMHPDSSEEIFIFVERMRDALTTPIPVDDHAPHSRSHGYSTTSYRRTHIMTSSISILVHIFVGFIFAEAGPPAKIANISTQRKFPTIWYMYVLLCMPQCILYSTYSKR